MRDCNASILFFTHTLASRCQALQHASMCMISENLKARLQCPNKGCVDCHVARCLN